MRRIKNIHLPEASSFHVPANLWTIVLEDNGLILSVQSIPNASKISGEDWQGDWLSPRGIDLQINGGLGLSFTELDFKELPKLLELLEHLWNDGIEAICPTFVSCSRSSLRLGLEVLREARKHSSFNRCKLLGAHLEGPFLSKDHLGAHDLNSICLPSLKNLNKLIDGFESEVSLFTIAPELDGAFDLIRYLKNLGVVVSLGHSSAKEEESFQSFEAGIEMITHSFNAMKGLNHRDIGPVGAAIIQGIVFMGLIADGAHINPNMAFLLHKLAPRQLVLVSDAIAPYGLSDGQYCWDNRVVDVVNGVCRLADRTLAGSTLPLLEACKNLAGWINNPSSAIWSATIAPRRVLKKQTKIENYFIGQNLRDLLRWKRNSLTGCLSWQPAA